MSKLAKAAVHYTDVARTSQVACWACRYFVPSGDRFAACQLVAGTISPSGWCDRFTVASAAERVARKVPGSVLNPGRQGPRAARLIFGDVASWAVAANIAPGDRIAFQLYAGRGRAGPEYREATGTVHLVGPEGPVVSLPGDRFGARPVVVTEDRFLHVVSRKRNPPLPYAIQYRDADWQMRVERVKAMDGKDYVTVSGKVVSPSRVFGIDDREPRRSPKENPARRLWFPSVVLVAKLADGQYYAREIGFGGDEYGYDVPTMRAHLPDSIQGQVKHLIIVRNARVGYDLPEQHGANKFKAKLDDGGYSVPMPLNVPFTVETGVFVA